MGNFKKVMKIEFEMRDLGLMKYFLGNEVEQLITAYLYANKCMIKYFE